MISMPPGTIEDVMGTEIVGRWWLPSSIDHDEAGSLHIDELGDMELSLHGPLQPVEWWNRHSLPSTPIILGLTNSHKLITLVSSLPRGVTVAVPGFRTERYSPQVALFGDHLMWDDLKFNAIRISFPGLSEWLGISGLQTSIGQTVRDLAVSVDPPTLPEFTLIDGTVVRIEFNYALPKLGHIDENVHVKYKFDRELDIDEATRYEGDLRHLVSIHNGASVAPNRVSLYSTHRSGSLLNKEDPGASPLDLVRPLIHSDRDSEARGELLFSAGQHPGGIEGVMRGWHQVAKRYRRVVDIASALYYAPQGYRNAELLLAATMVETLHRLSDFPQRVEREGLVAWRKLLETAPEEHRSWLSRFVSQKAEPSPRRRLEDLVGALGALGGRLVENVPEYERRLNRWRNAAVHHGQTDDLSGAHMYQLAAVTRLVVELFLMHEAGFDIQGEADRIQSTARFRRAARLKLEWPPLAAE